MCKPYIILVNNFEYKLCTCLSVNSYLKKKITGNKHCDTLILGIENYCTS